VANTITASNQALPQSAPEIARDMIVANTDRLGRVNAPELLRDVDALIARDGGMGAAVEKEIATQLGARVYKAMVNASYLTKASDGSTLSFSRNAPSIKDYFDGKQGVSGTTHYARLDRLWGDGNAKTFDGDKISAGIQDLLKSGLSLTLYENLQQTRATAAANQATADALNLGLDVGQLTLDIVGIFDPTGISDGANALISAGRGDWVGAGLSVVSIIPFVGDLAKAGKLGKWATTVAKAVDLAISNPTARKMLEPALRKLSDALAAIPESVMKNLPDELRTTLQGMKTKLDDLFGKVAGVDAIKTVPQLRQKYIDAVNKLTEKAAVMRSEKIPAESIARTLHSERRELGEEFKALTPPEKLAEYINVI
jgi:hypothetical protein